MEFDETILAARQDIKEAEARRLALAENEAIERERAQSIYDESTEIFGEKKIFVDTPLLEGLFSMRLPKDFTPLDEETIQRIYLLGNLPELVLTDEAYTFTISFAYKEYRLEKSDLREHAKLMQLLMERVGPRVNIIENEMMDCRGGEPLARLSFTSQAVDMAVYNIMFFASIEGRVLLGNLHFPYKNAKRFVSTAQEIIDSFCIIKKEEEEPS